MEPSLSLFDFQDCCWSVGPKAGWAVAKRATNNCYAKIPAQLAPRAEHQAEKRLLKFLTTTFAGAQHGLDLIMATQALVARGATLPDTIIVLVGPGGDGKSLMMVNLASGIWGSAFGLAPVAMLQVEEEFRKQGCYFTEKRWISFGECRQGVGVEEEVLKNLR